MAGSGGSTNSHACELLGRRKDPNNRVPLIGIRGGSIEIYGDYIGIYGSRVPLIGMRGGSIEIYGDYIGIYGSRVPLIGMRGGSIEIYGDYIGIYGDYNRGVYRTPNNRVLGEGPREMAVYHPCLLTGA